jgi:hypothetical protein
MEVAGGNEECKMKNEKQLCWLVAFFIFDFAFFISLVVPNRVGQRAGRLAGADAWPLEF